MEQKNKRHLACKVFIQSIIKGKYVLGKEQEPNYLELGEELKIYRINLIAVIINKEKVGMIANLLLDDGTGRIIARLFEESKALQNVEVGEVVQIIGRVRVFNDEKYISPEIIKKIDSLWLKVRNKELERLLMFKAGNNTPESNTNEKNEANISSENSEEVSNNEISNEEASVIHNEDVLYEKLVKLIKELDRGQGVLIEEVIDKSPLKDTETIINRMLENGDIFQNQPGKVKVL